MSYKEKPQIKLYKYQNSAFVLQAIIDDYAECSFENNRFQAGQFSITINYNIPNALLFERGLFIQFSNNPYAFGEIVNITDSIGADGKGSQIRIITGYDARYIFKRRIIKNLNDVDSWSMTAKGEICMRNLIQDQCGSNAETKRQLPITNVIPAPADAIGSEYSVSESFTNLYEVLTTIATQTEIGWRLNFNGSALSLEFYEGTDRHQTVRFDTDFESLSNGEFTDSSESFANSIYVCGKGEGEERDLYEGESAIEGSSPSGLERYEAYDNQSAMTTESEYEAEALAMLSQYSQTLQVSGQGLAKCPYEYGKEYDVGDIITVAFSGKSAVVQILSVTEHWTWGNYNLEFTFGKPQPDLNKQLQLILKQIQKASSKTTATASVKWYTVTNTTSMQSGEVIYDTLGFTGNVGTGKTFTLYLDDEKTGSKNYNIYIRNLTGTGKLTLTTGKTGATDIQLATGDYVGRIFVDENGNIIIESLTATSVIESGSNQPATSGAVADAINSLDVSTIGGSGKYISAISETDGKISATAGDIDTTVTSGSNNPVTSGGVANALNIPTDAVLHYSFDDVPDLPDGTAKLKYDNNFTDTTGWNGSATVSVSNGKLVFDATAGQYKYYAISLSANDIIALKGIATKSATLNITVRHSGASSDTGLKSVALTQGQYFEIAVIVDATSTNFNLCSTSAWGVTISQLYVGNGSYSTPIIDNANGQNNSVSAQCFVANNGVSGKGITFYNGDKKTIRVKWDSTNWDRPYTISCWVKVNNNNTYIYIVGWDSSYAIQNHFLRYNNTTKNIWFDVNENTRFIGYICNADLDDGKWHNIVAINKFESGKSEIWIDGEKKTLTIQTRQIMTAEDYFLIGTSRADQDYYDVTNSQLDDLLIFNRALTENEVMALYLNKANTPKYYSWADWKLNQIENVQTRTVETKGGDEEKPIEEEPKEEER